PGAAATVKPPDSVPVAPVGMTTLTSRVPGLAPPAIVSVAVICVADTTDTFDTVIPAPALTVAPAAKPVPPMVTATAVPGAPCAGEIDVTEGTSAFNA